MLPDSTKLKKLHFTYYDCHEMTDVPVSALYDNNMATISQTYNTVNAQIHIEYRTEDNWHGMTIFAAENPVTITFSGPIDETDPFKNCTLTNAQNLKQEYLALNEYIKEAQNNYQRIYDSIAPKWKAEDSLDFYKIQHAKTAIDSKRLEYFSSKPDSYGSFVLFKKYCLNLLPPDLLLQRFNSIFPAAFKDSDEGASIKKHLLNRAVIEGEKKAVSFLARDINNKEIVFKDIYTKKNVLLVFWGTWCPPCIAEIPLLKKIRQQYSAQQLEIVSVATSSPIEKVRQLIKEQQMDWTQIVNEDKINLLYQVHQYPELYLIDNNGNIIYKYSAYPDPNLGNLEKILEARLGAPKKDLSVR
jgi:thiol-disulfide isomerase/thioredoxin